MDDFGYVAPTSMAEAVAVLAENDGKARMLAGGTDILVQLREGLRRAELIVDVKKIPELTRIERTSEGGLRFGAAVPCGRLHGESAIARDYAGLADATRIIGAWQIQSRASVGGNLCNASPAADTSPILMAYAATLHLAGPSGERSLPVEQFFVSPGKTVLGKGELLVSIELPPPATMSGAAYLRFIPRNEMDIAVVGAGARLRLSSDGNTVEEARIAVGAVAPTPVLADEAASWLAGKPASEESFAEAGDRARRVARPISDMRGPADYRIHLVGVLVKRALGIAARRARGETFSGNGRH